MKRIIKGCEPFLYRGNNKKVAALLIHGLMACPYNVRLLGKYLHEELDITVDCPLLPGHGTSISYMADVTYEDWINEVKDHYYKLKEEYPVVYIVGQSAGGTLALYLSAFEDTDDLILIAPYLLLFRHKWVGWLEWFAEVFKFFRKEIKKKKKTGGLKDPIGIRNYIGYTSWHINGIIQQFRIARIVRKNLYRIKSPIVVFQSHHDTVVDRKGIDLLKLRTHAPVKVVWFKHSNHILTLDYEKHSLNYAVGHYIKERGL